MRGPTIPDRHAACSLPHPSQLSLFHARDVVSTTENAPVDGGLPSWLERFVREATHETETLLENGAEQVAAARTGLLKKLVHAAQAYADAELDASEAAGETGCCEETIRRAVRNGAIPDRRVNPRGRHKVRRGDLAKLVTPSARAYDPDADAQDIARLRSKL